MEIFLVDVLDRIANSVYGLKIMLLFLIITIFIVGAVIAKRLNIIIDLLSRNESKKKGE